MAATRVIVERQDRRRWRLRFSIRSLMAFVALVSMGLGFLAAYFADAQIHGDVYFNACWCGLRPATVSDGQVILTEQNHDTPAGTVVATVEIKDGICTLRRIDDDGLRRPAEEYPVDHLGAKYYHQSASGTQSVYILMVDNWKLYPASGIARIRRLLR